MTRVRARETLRDVDPDMEAELAAAAKEFLDAPRKFQAVIIKAADKGENANKITKAIGHAYSPDYVRRIIREARKAGKPAVDEGETAES